MLYAHSAKDDHPWQTLEEHLRNVSRLAGEFAAPFGQEEVARWLGWWHDAGKASEAFQRYLHEPEAPRGPDHSSAGMVEVARSCPPLSMVPAGHHGGLVDLGDLRERLAIKRADPAVQEALERVAATLAPEPAPAALADLAKLLRDDDAHQKRRAALLIRMLHSCLVDADCLDTERHFDPEQARLRERAETMADLEERLAANQAAFAVEAPSTPLNQRRARICDACVAAAGEPPGFFRLTVPTGGGKTRSAMAFALRHAVTHGLRRVVVALPYTSIIEQTCDVYRGIFGDEAVLEHHSALAAPEPADRSAAEAEAERRARLAAENWDAPLVVTTNVQLFESLFAARNSRLRKLHNLVRSVIVLDEVQTLPVGLLAPTLECLRLLVEDYGCTVVLSSATQPAFEQRDGLPDGIVGAREIVPDYPEHFRALARVNYRLPQPGEAPWSWDEVAAAAAGENQSLVVLNTKAHALALMERMPDEGLYHLSTNLCGAHRRQVLDEIRKRLKAGETCRVVSTQVIEAGVDVDFPLVLRALAGLDRIVQAAGRCNREGRLDAGQVIVFVPAEQGMPGGTYRTAAGITASLLNRGPLDLHDPAVFQEFFRPLHVVSELDKPGVQHLLAEGCFARAAAAYRMIEDEQVPMVVTYEPERPRIEALVAAVRAAQRPNRRQWRELQPFVVNAYQQALPGMAARGEASQLVDGLWLWHGDYDQRLGLRMAERSCADLIV